MSTQQRLENIKNGFSYKVKNDGDVSFTIAYRARSYFFPFTSRTFRPKVKENFDTVTGAYARATKQLNSDRINNIFTELENAFLDSNSTLINIEKQYSEDVKNQIITYLQKDNKNLKVLSPSLFSALQLHTPLKKADNTASIEIAYGEFIYSILGDGNIESLFVDSETNSLIKLINTVAISEKNTSKIQKQPDSICKLPFIKDLFSEDIRYLRKNEDMFLEKLPIFLHYYLMFYCSQLTLRFNKQFDIKEETNKPYEIYYILDDERLSSTRQAKIQGYNIISTASTNLYENIILLSALNYIFDTKLKTFYELKNLYNKYDQQEKDEILIALQEWIYLFNKSMNYQFDNSELSTFESACNVFYKIIGHGKSYKAQRSRYGLSLEELLYKFSKLHGNQGHSMSLSQENLLFFIQLSTKGERMKIKDVFSELEQRGIFFDSRTKTQVIEKLDKLNMIDSVSDSGDAKYVKEF